MSCNNTVIVSVGSEFPTALIIAFKYCNIDNVIIYKSFYDMLLLVFYTLNC